MPKLGRRSEVSGLDIIYNNSLTIRDAPFGTEYTPVLNQKIIGSRYIPVLERPYAQNVPRYEKITVVADKPNNVDPRALTDFSRRYNKPYEDPFSHILPAGGRPSNVNLKRPDSKDISSRYPTLPPIEENRLRNMQISTVFEPEPWTQQYRIHNKENSNSPNRLFNSTEEFCSNVKPLYNPRGSGIYGGRQTDANNGLRYSKHDEGLYSRHDDASISNEEFKRKLASLIPKGIFLPDSPIVLTNAEEARLLEVLAEELSVYSPLKLRDIYLDITNTSDKQLTGLCQYQDLYHSMSRHMFTMPGDLLQVTAAMFVSGDRGTKDVSYEKFLSFLGLALKKNEQKKQVNGFTGNQNHRPKTPVEQQVENYFADSETAKLLSTIEQQLRENDHVLNFGKLENELSLADNLGRGVLDLRTIMDICYQLNIPLQSSVLNRILSKCRLNSYDDCYNWKLFLEFLEKIQPRSRVVPAQLQTTPRLQPSHQQFEQRSPPASQPATPLWRREEAPPDPRRPLYLDQHDDDRGSSREVISRMDQDIRQLERNYEEIKERLKPRNDTPWFKNFMEFANALYKQDQRWEGDLPAEDVFKWTKMYNETGNLGLADHIISKALSDASKGGKVNIHNYLTKLGNVSNFDKI